MRKHDLEPLDFLQSVGQMGFLTIPGQSFTNRECASSAAYIMFCSMARNVNKTFGFGEQCSNQAMT